MTIDLVKQRLANADTSKPIVIAGTSQSMLDALAAIDAVGYKGKIVALSSNAVEPWPFDPVKEANANNDYPLKYLTKDTVAQLVRDNPESMAKAAAGFRALLVRSYILRKHLRPVPAMFCPPCGTNNSRKAGARAAMGVQACSTAPCR
jgi:hypothetical protein